MSIIQKMDEDGLPANLPDPDRMREVARYRWLRKRARWASVLVDFDRNSIYQRHRIVWFEGDEWHEVEGNGLDAAIDAAIAGKTAT